MGPAGTHRNHIRAPLDIVPGDIRPHINVQIGHNNVVQSLVDTGASTTCLEEQTFLGLSDLGSLREAPTPPKLSLAGASGTQLAVTGRYYLPLTLLGVTVTRPCYIIRGLGANKMIIGYDMISEMNMTIEGNHINLPPNFDPGAASLHVSQATVIPPKTVLKKRLYLKGVNKKYKPGVIAVIASTYKLPFAWEGIQEIQPDGSVLAILANTSEHNILVRPDIPIAQLQHCEDQSPLPASDDEIISLITSSMGHIKEDPAEPDTGPAPHLTPTEKADFLEKLNLRCPSSERDAYTELCLRFHDVFSKSKFDLGRTDVIQHTIRLKDKEPVHVKQFPLAHAHRDLITSWVDELLAQGAIEISRSCYNSPLFLVPKPDKSKRVVLDFRRLNLASVPDRYIIREIRDCIDMVGTNNSTVFSAIDLTSGFWQQTLEEESRQYTAFTVPGGARYQWTVTPMGLQGSPASFARLIDHVVRGLQGVIAYIDDLLAHSKTHPEQLDLLEQVFLRLRKFNLKLNPKKSIFGADTLQYLGYTLSGTGVGPGTDKLKAVREFPAPDTKKKIKQFLGLAGYFRFLVPNYAMHAAHLSKLTAAASGYTKGPLPPDSLAGFEYLKNALCLNPVVQHPAKHGEWHLTTDAAQGDADNPGGLGAVLTQVVDNTEKVIAYASRGLKSFEKNYSAYLLELAAAEWAIDYFHVYLSGRHFTLWTDHKPLTTLSTIHKRTLNRLQQQLLAHDFEIKYKPGESNTVADALSRNPVDVLSDSSGSLAQAQAKDPFCADVYAFLRHHQIPEHSEGYKKRIERTAKNCSIIDNIVYYWLRREGFRTQWAVLLPEALRETITNAAHSTWHGGHGGLHRTLNRIQQAYYWPGISTFVADFIKKCPRCQTRTDKKPPPFPLHSLPICDGANERIHIDLFGPLKHVSPHGNKFICVMTDAFTKTVELAALPDKSAQTVATAIFEKWICRYSVPIQIVTDNGKEFSNETFNHLCALLGVDHKTTSPYHPASNSSAESFNRSLKKYLTAMLDNDKTLEWEAQLPMLQLCYNCHVHQSTLESPFFLTYLHDPRLPFFNLEHPQPLYSSEYSPALFKTFSETYKRVHREQWKARNIREEYYNRKAKERSFDVGDRVLFYSSATPQNVNPKFFKHWQGPFTITEKFSPLNYELRAGPRSKKLLVHVEKIKHLNEEERKTLFDSRASEIDRSNEADGELVIPAETFFHAQRNCEAGFCFENTASDEQLNERAIQFQNKLSGQPSFQDETEDDTLSCHQSIKMQNQHNKRITRADAKKNAVRLLSPLKHSRI